MYDADLAFPLDAIEMRVLGALMEKSVTTPEYYPMTLNGLATACNQKTSREPVTDYDEDELLAAIDRLREKSLVRRVDMAGSRVAKFRQILDEALQLQGPEFALLTLLLLRGPQTPGQLRSRSERLFAFRDLAAVQDALDRLRAWDLEPNVMVQPLPLRPGSKEIRYMHMLGTWEETATSAERDAGEAATASPSGPTLAMRMQALEENSQALEDRIQELESLVEELKAQLATLRIALGD